MLESECLIRNECSVGDECFFYRAMLTSAVVCLVSAYVSCDPGSSISVGNPRSDVVDRCLRISEPSSDPCGIPARLGRLVDLVVPIFTLNFRSLK